jgi:16S rRNA (adenine1518-N6/adenine1519-N6)-dimethyltransferase
LGQSFLIDPNIITKIVRISNVHEQDIVLEIGAGLGIMTLLIAERAQRVVAVDIDPAMIAILRQELKDVTNIEIIHADILDYDVGSALFRAGDEGRLLKVIGNIPYNISTQILFRLIEARTVISEMVLMFQKEVGERLLAPPCTKDYGILSVLTGMFATLSKELSVPATCFNPPPKVDSIVLKISFLGVPRVELRDPKFFFKVVKTAFSKRRKTLFNNLKASFFFDISPAAVEEALELTKIDGKRRGESLTVEEFGRLSNALFSSQFSSI